MNGIRPAKLATLAISVTALLIGCIPRLAEAPWTLRDLVTLPQTVELTAYQKNSIDSLGASVDSLSERFLRLQSSSHIPSSDKKKWLSLTRRAEAMQKTIPANDKLFLHLGELYRIGIFFGVPDAAENAEFYLNHCVGLHPQDYRPYLLLAWLYLRRGCAFPEKTGYLLGVVDRKLADSYYPYLEMLWGYYYYGCKHDPEKAFGHLLSYLAFDPDDPGARKTYLAVKRELFGQ